MRAGEHGGEVPAHHHPYEVALVRGVGGLDADQRPVAQDGHPVGQPEDLLHAVGHVDDGEALRAQSADQREQGLHLVFGEGGRGFVEGHHLRLAGQRPQDLHQLALGRSEADAGRVRVEDVSEADPDQVLPEPATQRRPVEAAAAAGGQGAEVDVLGDREVRDDLRLLGDEPDAGDARVGRGAQPHLGAVDVDRAGVGRVVTADDLQQGGLARAVLAHQRGDRAGREVQADVAQGRDAGEALGQPGHAQSGGHHGGGGGGHHLQPNPASRQVPASTILVGAKASGANSVPFLSRSYMAWTASLPTSSPGM